MADSTKLPETFKIPHLLHSKESLSNAAVDEESNQVLTDTENVKEEKSVTENKGHGIKIEVPLPYKVPEWSGLPPPLYGFEIIKNGTVLENYNIETPVVVFGRLDVCSIVFEHPSVSRYHAVVQYCGGDCTHPKGFYLYDLGSTHGTFLNKEKVTPKVYYKLKVGYILKFGGSSRLYIFQGPEEQEAEEKPSPKEEEVCTWGISEDAEEEEDLSENPYALSTPNEDSYINDPKKTLRNWFEREGYELEYDVEERGFRTFACRIHLPIDNATGDFMPIEASVSGKKKEAVIACALEACRTLDRLGLLRQSHQESRQVKKNWEENDYYDSDEDTFLDRTGTIEKKREMRKRNEKKVETETFQSLETKLNAITKEINDITDKLTVCKAEIQLHNDLEDDTLEAYMCSLSNAKEMASDKMERRKLKFRLIEAEKEKSHLAKLLEIAKPTKLPPITKYPGMIGKKKKTKFQNPVSQSSDFISPIKKLGENEEEVEEDSDLEDVGTSKIGSSDIDVKEKNIGEIKNIKTYGLILKDNATYIPKEDVKIAPKDDTCRDLPSQFLPDLKVSSIATKVTNKTADDVSPPKKVKKDHKKIAQNDVYTVGSAEYSTWIPPSNQTGDGITHLNAKYGY